MELPAKLSDKASGFPEPSYGATKVTLLLSNGDKIENVTLAWGEEIIKIQNKDIHKIKSLGFTKEDIVDVLQY
ncbi:MAG: hypothetical protein KBT55_03390 [Porticoccus sp.]|nr:hypothetical protein [Porticoccus sp.]